MTKEHAYAYESGYQDGMRAASQIWHRMADTQPTKESANYLLLGKRGALYVARGFHVWPNGSKNFYIPNNRGGYVDFETIKAWAEIPEYEMD